MTRSPAFSIGESVHVPTLGTGTVREVRKGGRYVVELKGRAVVLEEAQIERAQPARARRGRNGVHPAGDAPQEHAAEDPGVVRTIDLHGMTAAEAVGALDSFLNDAVLGGAEQLRIIHGRSGNRLKSAVHARLAQLPPVRAFRLDPRNPGVTIVTL